MRETKGLVLAIFAKDKLQFLIRVLVGWVEWSSSTWVPRRFSVGRPSACSHFVASQQMENHSMPDNTAIVFQVHYLVTSVPMAIVSLVGNIPVTGYLRTALRLLWHA